MSAAIANEETLIIETPERVPLHFALASIGNRFLACAFDHALQTAASALFYLLLTLLTDAFDFAGLKNAPNWTIALLLLLGYVLWSSYFIIFEWLWNGQTPGKRWLKLRVIREDGRPITFWEAAVRNLLRLIDVLPFFPFYSVGIISVFVSARDQRVGDLVAGTVVVRERETEAPTFSQVFNAPIYDSALRRSFKSVEFTAEIEAVTEREIEVVETYLRRRWDLPDQTRVWMAYRVAMPLLYKLRPGYDLATFTYEGFLEELLHRYHARNRFRN